MISFITGVVLGVFIERQLVKYTERKKEITSTNRNNASHSSDSLSDNYKSFYEAPSLEENLKGIKK